MKNKSESLKQNKLLQIIAGVVSIALVLAAGVLLTNTITYPDTPTGSFIEKAIAVVYPLLYLSFMVLAAFFAKSNNLKYFFFPLFAIALLSTASACFHYYLFEDTLYIWLIIPLAFFGYPLWNPVRMIATGIENATAYEGPYYNASEDYHYYYGSGNYLYEYEILLILVVFTIFSAVVYQLHTETDEQQIKKECWKLKKNTQLLAVITTAIYGSFFLLSVSCHFTDNFATVLGEIQFDILWGIFTILSITFTFTGTILWLPFALLIPLFGKGIAQAQEEGNIRKAFNPWIILALISTIAGTVSIYNMVMSGF